MVSISCHSMLSMNSYRQQTAMAETKFRSKTRTVYGTSHLTRTVNTKCSQTRTKSLNEKCPRSDVTKFGNSKKPKAYRVN